jgi:uncharacterized protein YdeI (YjbR/CyaY-like superfamily)
VEALRRKAARGSSHADGALSHRLEASGRAELTQLSGSPRASLSPRWEDAPRQESERVNVTEPRIFFKDAGEFETWLEEHSGSSDGVWIEMAKKGTGIASLDWKQGVEVALCFGWIDGQSKRIDDDWFIQRFTPRRPKSTWSKSNREKVEALIDAGRMRPAGLAEIERAKADGRWNAAYDGMATSSVPDDLVEALANAGMNDTFATLDSRNRYAILHRIQTATRPETRARRIEKYVEMLSRGDKPYP